MTEKIEQASDGVASVLNAELDIGVNINSECQKEKHKDRCCCNCACHIEDFHHCTTVNRATVECVCKKHKGWICMSDNRAYSGWTEHGICEMHIKRVNV